MAFVSIGTPQGLLQDESTHGNAENSENHQEIGRFEVCHRAKSDNGRPQKNQAEIPPCSETDTTFLALNGATEGEESADPGISQRAANDDSHEYFLDHFDSSLFSVAFRFLLLK